MTREPVQGKGEMEGDCGLNTFLLGHGTEGRGLSPKQEAGKKQLTKRGV